MSKQLELFGDEVITVENGHTKKTYDIQWENIIGSDNYMSDVFGYIDLSEKAQELLKYLMMNHINEEDGFIHAGLLAHTIGLGLDTRTLRKLCAEIDYKTEYVVYASQEGYKLVSSDREMQEAVKFALAPAMSSIRRVFAKNKRETLHWIHGFLGNLEKEFGGQPNYQQQFDDDLNQREVNHFPKTTFIEEMPSIEDRVEYYNQEKKVK